MPPDCWTYLANYNRWRSGTPDQTMAEAGLTPSGITDAITTAIRQHRSCEARLVKAYADRARLHLEVRKLRKQVGSGQ